ncbi:salicylate/benzoate carboxyl methyltransferase [Eutrema salsugineum]|uniref:salicylate/benzoate carboxyl methyltransferase n=1 Tax=Eutrema salsugineum TaxID=72664 RepID=UPI000CED4A18|nr:salicylate/benzoate carboxyl methyltransferase [Eutrema salsugineum]
MKGGDGEHSYANNSEAQKIINSEAKLAVVENVKEMIVKMGFPGCIKVADLGCSSGENTFLAMSEIVNTIISTYQQKGQIQPEIDCCLNDLPDNDFNTTFKLIPSFHEKLKMDVKEMCFVSGVPGSFYSRLFPSKSLHFVHSSFSLHWLSKVPPCLEENKTNVYLRSPCPPNVYKSYLAQFKNDFSLFLRMRAEETMPNGRMALTFLGRKALDPLSKDCFRDWSLISDSLLDLVSEGIVKESEVEYFNMPFYNPDENEVKEVIENEGTFEINNFETIFGLLFSHKTGRTEVKDDDDLDQSRVFEVVRKRANLARSITEPMLAAHFGDAIIDRLFDRYTYHLAQSYHTLRNKPMVNFLVSLIKK